MTTFGLQARRRAAFPCILLTSATAFMHLTSAASVDPVVDASGAVQVRELTLPYSAVASREGRKEFIARAAMAEKAGATAGTFDVNKMRQGVDAFAAAYVQDMSTRFPVRLESSRLGGINVEVFTPTNGISERNRSRILINIHGGGFVAGAHSMSQAESIPIAAAGRYKVISVDYRMGPESKFPAASEDVGAVYQDLLKTYKPEDIGIYGCSAGGIITGEMIAWLVSKALPLPGAIGIFSASTGPFSVGDSHHLAPILTGTAAMVEEGGFGMFGLYFGAADPKDPLVYPANSAALLARFPPTLLISGTRAEEMSSVIRSHIDLVKAGVDARLFVWEGMMHGFIINPKLPESNEAYHIITKFFDDQLGHHHARPAAAERANKGRLPATPE
jgi:monoterpene epsilon-lactone hydrolase